MSVNSTDPGTLFGGAWERIQDTFLLCAGSSYAAGATGGSATMAHTHSQVAVTSGGPSNNTSGGPSSNSTSSTSLSVSQMPSHSHPCYSPSGHTWGVNYGSLTATNTTFTFTPAGVWASQYGGEQLYASAVGSGSGHSHTLNSHTHSLQSHTHSIGATTTGGASNTNNMPPYLAVYVWKRTA